MIQSSPSPLVRRHRLAVELVGERTGRKMTSRQLAARAFLSQSKIARLENESTTPNVADVQQYLNGLGIVDGDRWKELIELATQAAQGDADIRRCGSHQQIALHRLHPDAELTSQRCQCQPTHAVIPAAGPA